MMIAISTDISHSSVAGWMSCDFLLLEIPAHVCYINANSSLNSELFLWSLRTGIVFNPSSIYSFIQQIFTSNAYNVISKLLGQDANHKLVIKWRLYSRKLN